MFEVRETPPTGNRSVDTSLVSASKDADKEINIEISTRQPNVISHKT